MSTQGVNTTRLTAILLRGAWLFGSGLTGCGAGGGAEHKYEPPTYTKPGAALNKVSCSCLACVSADACEGRSPMGRDEQGCEGGFQMRQSMRFEATVSACQPSCFRRGWSVPSQLSCDDRRPEDCCQDM